MTIELITQIPSRSIDLITQIPRSFPERLILISIVILEAAFGATVILIPLLLLKNSNELPSNWWWMIVLYYGVSLSTASWFGYLSDKIGRRPLLIFGTFMAGLSLLPFAFYGGVQHLWVLFLANGIKGLGNAAIIGPNLALFADFAPKNSHGEFMGKFYLARSAGGALGFLLGTVFFSLYGPGSFLLFALMMLVPTQIFILIDEPRSLVDIRALQMAEDWKIQVEGETQDEFDINPFHTMADSLKDKEFRLFAIVWLLFSSIIGIGVTYAPTILALRNIDPAVAVLPLLSIAIIVGATQTTFGRLSDRHGRKPFLLLGAIGTTLLIGLIRAILDEKNLENFESYIQTPFALDFQMLIPISDLLTLYIPFYLLTFIIIALVFTAGAFPASSMGFLADVTKQGERGGKMGLIQSLLAIGSIIGIILGSIVLDLFQVPGVLTLCFILGLATTIFIMKLSDISTPFRSLFSIFQKS